MSKRNAWHNIAQIAKFMSKSEQTQLRKTVMIIITYLGVNKIINKIGLGWLKLKHSNSTLFRRRLEETVIKSWNFQGQK